VEVDGEALRRNLRTLRGAGGRAEILPMVKADAYGLGVGQVLRALAGGAEPVWGLGVAAVSEGVALRELGWQGRVVVFSPAPGEEYGAAAAAGLTLALSGSDGARRWAAAARRLGRRLAFHLEIDTGMGRSGLPFAAAATEGARIAEAAGDLLLWEGCFTHFHSADEPDLAPTDEQERRFRDALGRLPPGRRLVHSANSAATLRRGGFGHDLVRPGIFLYGGSAGPGTHPAPVVSVLARLVAVREVPAGWTCGYGATYRATRAERWGTLAIGYGDGVPRALSPAGGAALVRGRRVPIVGRVSMDATVVDLTELPEAREGDVATLIGSDGEEAITLGEFAERCGTIPYEVLTGLGPRLPRVARGGTSDHGRA
jgi:alanine racemase